ncbi:hypothetical protein BGX27_011542 [Mortierella sp. AM989]|nr:hypothetical protein BGX27_011542 [Mortierella sp. AM989]
MTINISERETLSALILTITKTGDLYLDPAQVKQVRSICKKSDANVKIAYELLLIQLQRKHAQIRFSSTQLIAELFQRSHVFRELLVADYSIFLQLTVGIHQNTLPPPAVFAEKTKQLAISLTNEWNSKYGAVYKQITLGYEFLRYHLKVDFSNLVPVTEEARSAEQRAQEEMSRRLRRKRYEKTAVEMDDMADDLQDNVRKMNSCFEILVPKLDDDAELNAIFSAPSSTSEKEQSIIPEDDQLENMGEEYNSEEILRHDPIGVYENALGSNRYKLTINVNKDKPVDVTESEENTELFTTLRECYRLIIKKHWPMVMEWLDVLMKVDHEPDEQRSEYNRLLRMAIDLKKIVADAKSKSEDLGVNLDTMYGPNEYDSDEDDEEFEEVEISASNSDKKKGKQVKKNTENIERKKHRNAVFAMQGEKVLADDPTYVGGTRISSVRSKDALITESANPHTTEAWKVEDEVSTRPIESSEDAETREDLLSRAPVIPWDDDLAVWDKKEIAFNTSGLEYSHRFLGVGDGSNMVSQATLERMKMRTRVYDPELPTVIKACRFPMSNGRLCSRRDLVKCPYHGPVVPRDEYGQIQVSPEEGGFIPEHEELDDIEEANLINRAIAAASGSSTSRTSSTSQKPKDKSTWEDIEDDVNLALGLEKIGLKRRQRQGEDATSKRKKNQKPPSSLINISKAPDSSRVRLLKHVGSKLTRNSIEQDRRLEKTTLSKDSRMHRWQ